MSPDDRRRAILHCAARLFSHYGQAKTTIADIAREADVGIGTVYLVFPSKEAIVEELSSTAHVRVLDAMREIAEARAGDSFSERLAGVLETRIAMFQKLAAEGQHACELVHCKNGPVKSVHTKFRDDERALIERIFVEAASAGELASLDPKRAAGLIQRAYATLSPPWLFEQPAEEVRLAARDMCRLLLLGLLTRVARSDDTEHESTGTTRAKANAKPARHRDR